MILFSRESGPIDVFIVNQGVFTARELEKHSLEDVKFTIEVNLVGSFNVIKAALPGMKARKGRGPGSISLVHLRLVRFVSRDLKRLDFYFKLYN